MQSFCVSGNRALLPAAGENHCPRAESGARRALLYRAQPPALRFERKKRKIVCLAPLVSLVFALPFWPLTAAAFSSPSTSSSRTSQAPPDSSPTIELAGNRVPWARAASDLGPVPNGTLRSRMLLILRRTPQQESGLRALLRAQQDIHSPQYHRWLTPEQFGARFGAPREDIDRVIAWLRSQGIAVAGVSRGRQVIEFSATAGQIRQAFATELHRYRVGSTALIANASAPLVPASLQPVVAGFDGLHDSIKQSFARPAERWPPEVPYRFQGPELADGAQQYLSPGDFWTIYNVTPAIDAGITGKGVTIGIAGRSDVSTADVARFRSNYLTSTYAGKFQQIVNGPDPGTVAGDDLESTLDAEWAGALAPDANVLLLVSASNGTDGVDLSAEYLVDNDLADVVSLSYGLCEELLGTSENQFFAGLWQQAAAEGITVVVAAGDNGSAGCDDASNGAAGYGLQVNGLASTPYNVAVGGTEFYDASGAWSSQSGSSPLPGTSALGYIPEKVWNESQANGTLWAGSGGSSNCTTVDIPFDVKACSGGWPKPDWQGAVYGVPDDGARDLPDVSFSAAVHTGYILWIGGGMESVGGTSAATPSFAGVMALLNQKLAGRQGLANAMLYQLAASQYGGVNGANSVSLAACNAAAPPPPGNACTFYDVAAGSNAVACVGGSLDCSQSQPGSAGILSGFDAGAGFDLATGIGSVNVANLLDTWSGAVRHGTPPATSTTLSASPSTVLLGESANLSAQVASSSGTPGGTVAFTVENRALGSVSITAGTAALANTLVNAANGFSAGANTVTAAYSGGANYAPSSGSTVITAAYPVTASPSFSIASGTYTAAQTVAIADATPNAAIYYTSSGSTPTAASTAYTAPITVAVTQTLQAIAVASCCLPSPVVSAAYTIAPPPPLPSIAHLSPVSAHAGATGFTLILGGSGFNPNSTVFWGSSALPTQQLSATELQAQVPAAAIANPGAVTLTVQGAGNISNPLQFEVDSSSSSTPAPFLPSTTATVTAGSIATYPVALPSAVSAVTASCLNLPAGAQCAYSPATEAITISTAASTPRGSYQVTVVFIETVSVSLAGLVPFLIGLMVLARMRRRLGRLLGTALLLAAALALAASLGSCGGSPGSGHAAQQVTCATAVNLVVQ